MKTHNIEITHQDACFIYDLLNEVVFSSRRLRENPQMVTVRTVSKWNLDRLCEVKRFFDGIANGED